jgi:DNA-binding GntR family transcriptional regulator
MDRRSFRLTAQVFERLREDIVRGVLAPNTQLSEQDLCSRLGVSRTPVREALIKLAEEELVDVYPQVGTFVAPISLDAVKVGQYVREHLECALVADAARRIDAEGVERIRDSIARQEQATSPEEAFALDNEFHRLIAELSGHVGVWAVLLKTKTQFDRVRYLSVRVPARAAEIVHEHRLIADALMRGDDRAVQVAMRSHLRGVFATVESLPASVTRRPDQLRRRRRTEGTPAH